MSHIKALTVTNWHTDILYIISSVWEACYYTFKDFYEGIRYVALSYAVDGYMLSPSYSKTVQPIMCHCQQ